MSSIVNILCEIGNSNISAERSELFPAPLAPLTSIVLLLSTRNDNAPAVNGSMVPLAMSLDNVQGVLECFLMANESPLGLIGYPTTVALASESPISVSRTGLDSQNGSPLSLISMVMMFLISLSPAMRLVLHLTWEFEPFTLFNVTWMRFLSQGASM